MARKKQHHAEHPDERWLLTYADMITLLMALFMVLYAMSMVNKTKFEALRTTLKQSFSGAILDRWHEHPRPRRGRRRARPRRSPI